LYRGGSGRHASGGSGFWGATDFCVSFFFLAREEPPPAARSKTSVVFTTQHVPGALYNCLGELAERGINLTKLESRPSRTKPWHYVFYLDFEGHRQDPPCEEALLGLLRRTSFVKVLGSYPAVSRVLARSATQ
jgi:prephenate dehydratase